MEENEAKFTLDELFFSKTDPKGIIQTGNAVFVRVSEYEESELLRKPHNIIRHPDMPRSVFKLFWDFLRSQRAIAAYIKNRSKAGRYYWVFAMAFPMADGGYLSVRLKPTSSLFTQVQALYKEVLEMEAGGATLEAGIEHILKRLQELGFSSYEEFMVRALLSELESRDSLMLAPAKNDAQDQRATNEVLESFLSATELCSSSAKESFVKIQTLFHRTKGLVQETQAIIKTCHDVKYVTVNLTISSAKLGDVGKPLSVVSKNLEKLTSEISDNSARFEEIFKSYEKSVYDMYFFMAVSRFQMEMMSQLISEVKMDSQGQAQLEATQQQFLFSNSALLRTLIEENFKKVTVTSAELTNVNKSLISSVEALSKVTAGMGVIHVVGKIEMARTGSTSDSLSSRLREMEELTEVFKRTLKNLENECTAGLEVCEDILNYNKDIVDGLHRIGTILAAG